MKRGVRWRFSWALFLGLVALNLTAVVQAEMFAGERTIPAQAGRLAEELVRVAGWAGVFTALAGALPQRARRGAAAVLLGLSLVLCGVDGFTLAHYHSVLDAGLLEIVFATNPAEAWEYVTSQSGGIAVAAGALVSVVGFVVAGGRFLRRRKDAAGSLGRRGAAVLCVLLLAFLASLVHAAMDEDDRVENAARSNSILRLALNIRQAHEEIGSAEFVAWTLANHEVGETEGTDDIPYVVFILGESTSRHHMQLYGYGLPTTPKLAARAEAGELVAYENVTSPHAGTMAVLRTLFSFYDNDANGMWYDYGDLFDILRQAGVYTAWLSNQEASGFYGSIGRTLGERTDHVAFTSPVAHSIDLAERYDSEVLPLLDEELRERVAEPVPAAFYVIHLMGAHEEFSKRYPPEFARFMPEDEAGRGALEDASARAVRAAYDNAVLYDDAIVDEIIRRFEDKDALVIFISDHGEEVYDTRAQFGHGDETSPWQRDVPMVFWMSNVFRTNHPADVQRIEAARGNHWQSDEMIHTLLDLMHVRVADFDETKSLLAPRQEQAEKEGNDS
ncbi:MAG: sulfatase-like hydrolase/transferase [Veillonellaceae bacterium]|uniref:phosphoethanolamine transferase n=1 Tax=uncultured Selenomonas sp. TaxID=159275 RepID=UPI0025F925F0|nr:phosphoethanolamine transferase [uncultured Selenomonas sp.]MDD6127058.1 sulfatase-like hydrolase/transferase [Veillonellaceae bacterium]MDD6697804.1 sulfatase-like hydrolase/transferase [Veillonellaceae bacterium]